jgi:acylphosphatase
MEMICRVIIRGRVQGVGFRAWAEITALELGIEGWVRNRRDGSVEVLLAGSEEAVLTMVESCHDGPPGAKVAAVDQTEAGEGDLELRRPAELFSVLASG